MSAPKIQLQQAKKIRFEVLLNELQEGRKDIMKNRIGLHDMNQQICLFYRNIAKMQNKAKSVNVFLGSQSIETNSQRVRLGGKKLS